MSPNTHLHIPVVLFLTCQGGHESSVSGVDVSLEVCSLVSTVEKSNHISIASAFIVHFLVSLIYFIHIHAYRDSLSTLSAVFFRTSSLFFGCITM